MGRCSLKDRPPDWSRSGHQLLLGLVGLVGLHFGDVGQVVLDQALAHELGVLARVW